MAREQIDVALLLQMVKCGLRIGEVAKFFTCTDAHVYNLCKANNVPIPKHYYMATSAMRRLMAGHAVTKYELWPSIFSDVTPTNAQASPQTT